MPLLHSLLRATAFRTPLLGTLVPTVALAYGIQTAVAVPSIAAQTERFYDLSGSLTYLSCTALSFFLPYLRARTTQPFPPALSHYLAPPAPGQRLWWWRHAVLSAAVAIWATRLGSFLFKRITDDHGTDSRFDKIRSSPARFYLAFFAQATWVSLCTLPVVLVNSLPRSAFASTMPSSVSAQPYFVELLGLAVFVFGFTFEVLADRQKSRWTKERKEKKHSEEFLARGLWSKSRHPNYFGEITLWSGIAITASGLLLRQPAQAALGLSGATGKLLVAAMCAASPAFVTLLLLKVSGIPLSENKYDSRYGDRKDYQRWKRETPMLIPKFQ